MKTTLSFLVSCLSVFAAARSLLSSASDVVYDSYGNTLLRGFPYYVLPLLRGSGGGFTLSRSSSSDTCQLEVTQEPFELGQGVPFTFNPIVLEEAFVRARYPTSIEADVENPCSGSNIWKVSPAAAEGSSEDVAAQIVTTDGEFNTPESCFQIVEDELMPEVRSYQIQHCPFKCVPDSPRLTCYNVSLISDADGKRYLAPTDDIFPVVFGNSFRTIIQSAVL